VSVVLRVDQHVVDVLNVHRESLPRCLVVFLGEIARQLKRHVVVNETDPRCREHVVYQTRPVTCPQCLHKTVTLTGHQYTVDRSIRAVISGLGQIRE